ncbi:hypothetical protein [Endozoicomonas euniceicola]|uniref:Uncharacterized protein n=1 Tax=Endozoicomonas euniceicola TaxID=1234143 RepID=A0ABY6GS55_9GAMM|nr:hypothetical protein [Endozoicomonas euniceicola]UYM15249.1 hypothetical protein NX720_20675 [Endozoicomonas euniceicola]
MKYFALTISLLFCLGIRADTSEYLFAFSEMDVTTQNKQLNNIFLKIKRGYSRANCFPPVDNIRQKFISDWYPTYKNKLINNPWASPEISKQKIDRHLKLAAKYNRSEKWLFNKVRVTLKDAYWKIFSKNLWDDLSRNIFNYVESYAICEPSKNTCFGSLAYNIERNKICKIELKENYFSVTRFLVEYIVDLESALESKKIIGDAYSSY